MVAAADIAISDAIPAELDHAQPDSKFCGKMVASYLMNLPTAKLAAQNSWLKELPDETID